MKIVEDVFEVHQCSVTVFVSWFLFLVKWSFRSCCVYLNSCALLIIDVVSQVLHIRYRTECIFTSAPIHLFIELSLSIQLFTMLHNATMNVAGDKRTSAREESQEN